MHEKILIEVAVVVFIFGTMIGSFLNVVIYRIPKGESIVFPASKCQSCQTPLKWWHNIPLFSWLFLRGKCYFCKEKISAQYPMVELLTGVIFVALYFKLGLVWHLPFVAAAFAALLALVMIDFEVVGEAAVVVGAVGIVHFAGADCQGIDGIMPHTTLNAAAGTAGP